MQHNHSYTNTQFQQLKSCQLKQTKRKKKSQQGFTLVELMIVIVVMGVVVSLVLFNLQGIDHRKALQARDAFILDLQRIKKESLAQGQVLALQVNPATDVTPFTYQVVQYQPNQGNLQNQTNQALITTNKKWQRYDNISSKTLPNNVSFNINSLSNNQFNGANNQDLTSNEAPILMWLGNGEVSPVSIQFYYKQQPISEPIQIDYLGNIDQGDDEIAHNNATQSGQT